MVKETGGDSFLFTQDVERLRKRLRSETLDGDRENWLRVLDTLDHRREGAE